MSTLPRILTVLLCMLLVACAGRPRAVVSERSSEPSVSRSVGRDRVAGQREYRVVRGDTLFGIAFRHGVDFRALAQWNRIAPPYTIYPGQRLRLGTSPDRRASPPPRTSAPRSAVSSTPGSITGMPAPATSARFPTVPPPTTPAPTPTPTPTPNSASPASVQAPPPGGVRVAQGVLWRWPASGQIVTRYVGGDPTRQGINIAGSGGQPVFAAAAGEVVYSGAGLIGYGELVIIKHSDEFLSAYGHNRKRLVAEGQRVTAGQQVAEMGRSGAARDMLHFEIRRNGKPIDPLPLLPTR